jgi:hypothetical protein
MTIRIRLNREWLLGDRIGAGGFGQVYAATAVDGEAAVVKLIPKTPGADRELLFVELRGVRNVVPIIDSGDAGTSWAIVMPRAEMSLRQYLDSTDYLPTTTDVVAVLTDIIVALVDIDGKVVHRDLKPENILRLHGTWCLADFGISRYAEASTAPDTQKFALSPPYAAPERWRAERATTATDIYSFGVIAFELLTQRRPFPGPDLESYRDQHLHDDAPELDSQSPTSLKALTAECLYKAAGARPSPGNILARLQRLGQEAVSGGRERLREAHLAEVARRSESERRASEGRSVAERRSALFKIALESGKVIKKALFDAVVESAPTAARSTGKFRGEALSLGPAQIEFFGVVETGNSPWERWAPSAFDVVAHSGIIIRVPRDEYGYEGRSHSLWFCDAQETARYQWFETAFMVTPMVPRSTTIKPFKLDPGEEAAKALWNGVAEWQLAWPLTPLTTGDLEEFIDRWASWFADASDGRLRSPSMMPERPTPRDWRQR